MLQEAQKVHKETANNINLPQHYPGSHQAHKPVLRATWVLQWPENTCKLLLIQEAANPYNHCQIRFFSPLYQLCNASDPPLNDKVFIDLNRTQQDPAKKGTKEKREMSSESLAGRKRKVVLNILPPPPLKQMMLQIDGILWVCEMAVIMSPAQPAGARCSSCQRGYLCQMPINTQGESPCLFWYL